MDIQLLINIPVILGISTIALLMFVRKGSKGEVYFAAFAALLALWLFLQFIAQLGFGETGGLRLLQGASFVANFLIYAFFLFVATYTNSSFAKKRRVRIAVLAPLIILALASFTPLMIREVEVSTAGIAIKDAGFLYFVQLALFVLYFGTCIILLIRDTLRKPPRLRSGNYLLIIALSQAALLTILASSVFAAYSAPQVLIPFSLFVMIALISYGIVRRGLFDIRLVAVRALAYLLVLSTFTAFFVAVIFVTTASFATEQMSLVTEIFYIIVALLVASLFQPLKKFFDRTTSKLFYQDAYDPQLALNDLNQVLVSTLDVEILLNKTVEILETNIKTEYCAFVMGESSRKHVAVVGQIGELPLHLELSQAIQSTNDTIEKVIVTDALVEESNLTLRQFLMRGNIAAVVRIIGDVEQPKGEVGFLIFGHKKSGNPFSKQDTRMLEIVGNELVIAIQNALRFEEIQNFNVKLAKEVEDATYRLRKTNEKLVALDAAKDEFISMASHQLRTPLTSVKGYLSMVLEGDAGKISPKERKLLNQAFASSQRMVYLISDLLNLSRLRTGKFVIEPNPVNLAEVIGGEVDQLVETAASHNIKLTYHKPKDFPTLMFDETKIRQVIMNFIDNAIHYTPSGGKIDVRLENNPHSVEFTVIDTGIGVAKHEQPHLFTKFFRAGNAKKARPDGTGLGLYMAKKIIIAQGGSVIFKSVEGKGSTFGFTFPKAKLQLTAATMANPTTMVNGHLKLPPQ